MHYTGRRRLPVLTVLLAAALLIATACGSEAGDARPPGDASSAGPAAQSTATGDADPGDVAADRAATAAYAREVDALLEDLTAASNAVADVLADADTDSSAWRTAALEALAAFDALHQRAQDLAATDSTEDVHARLLSATDAYAHAAALLGDSVEDLDLDALEEANLALGDALVAAAEARLLLADLSAD